MAINNCSTNRVEQKQRITSDVPATSNLKKTKVDCILIEIKVSDDQHEELKIRSGEGDWYNLFADTTSVDFQTGVGS